MLKPQNRIYVDPRPRGEPPIVLAYTYSEHTIAGSASAEGYAIMVAREWANTIKSKAQVKRKRRTLNNPKLKKRKSLADPWQFVSPAERAERFEVLAQVEHDLGARIVPQPVEAPPIPAKERKRREREAIKKLLREGLNLDNA